MLQHFVVIYKVTDKYILIMDPGDGKLHKKSYEDFKDFGAQIMYNRIKNTFYYANNFEFILTIRTSPLNYQEKNHIFGGKVENKWNSANSLHYNQISLLMLR